MNRSSAGFRGLGRCSHLSVGSESSPAYCHTAGVPVARRRGQAGLSARRRQPAAAAEPPVFGVRSVSVPGRRRAAGPRTATKKLRRHELWDVYEPKNLGLAVATFQRPQTRRNHGSSGRQGCRYHRRRPSHWGVHLMIVRKGASLLTSGFGVGLYNVTEEIRQLEGTSLLGSLRSLAGQIESQFRPGVDSHRRSRVTALESTKVPYP